MLAVLHRWMRRLQSLPPSSSLGQALAQAGGDIPAPGDGFRVPRNAPPGLEAGAARRRLALWQPAAQHINALMQTAGPTVIARARWLVRNNGYARAALRSWSAATVGAGIKPSSLVAERSTREIIHTVWNDWTDEADAEELTDFYGITRRVSREAFLAGEAFVRLRPRFPQDGLLVPLQLQLLPSEQLPLWKQEVAPNGAPIRLGIEFDRNLRDKRVAYWFYRSNPTDPTVTFRDALQLKNLVRVPAEEVIHVFDPVEAGQLRGLTGYAAAVVKLFQMDAYDDAELERQKQQSRYATFFTTPDERDDEGNPLDPRPDDDLSAYMPGANVLLYGGEDVKFAEPGGVPNSYEPFQYRTLLQICAALGIPYGELSWDLTKATYASSRAGLLAFRQEVEAFQHAVLVFQFLRRVWAKWMDTAVLAGAVPISAQAYNARPAVWRAMQAITPRAPWVDPLKDRQAIKLALDGYMIAPQDAIEAEGYDIETVYRRIAEAAALRRQYGIPDPAPGWGTRGGPTATPTETEALTSSEAA
jgi:lambda family phage portal protein